MFGNLENLRLDEVNGRSIIIKLRYKFHVWILRNSNCANFFTAVNLDYATLYRTSY
jgi:hypothetical protein